MAEDILYKEFHMLRWLVWGVSVASFGVLFYAISREAPANGWLVISGFVGFFVAQFLAAVHRVNRIALTESHLRVGKETFERSDFDFNFGVQPPLVLFPDEEERVNEDWPLPPDQHLRIAGGAWGRRRGTATVMLREAGTRKVVAICTRHPLQLDDRLTEWLETPPEEP